MVKYFLFILFLSVPFLAQSQDSVRITAQDFLKRLDERQKALEGQSFLTHSIETAGKTLSKPIFINKVTLVNFWFAECRPCLLEFDGLNRLYDTLNKYGNFQFISFTYEKPDVIDEIKKKYKLDFEITSVSYEEFKMLNRGFGSPLNVVVNKEGKIKYWKAGGEVSKEKTTDFILHTIYPKLMEEL